MSGWRLRRALVASGAIALLGGAVLTAATPMTDASWTDRESAKASFTALDVPEPATTAACTTRSGALGINRVTLNWRVPAAVTGYSKDSVEFGQRTNQGTYSVITANAVNTLTTTGDATAYTTQVSGAALGSAIGDKKTVAIRFAGAGGWKSDWVDACTFDAVRSRILTSQITVTASSQETVGSPTPATNVNDDDATTGWVSRWSTAPTTVFPHTLTFDLGHAQSVDGVSQRARQSNSVIKDYTIEVSTDGVSYTPAASGQWAQVFTWQDVNFTPRTARYVRITGTSSTTGFPWASVNEVAIFGTPTP